MEKRDIGLITCGNFITKLANSIYNTMIVLFVLQTTITRQNFLLGLIMAAPFIGTVVFSPFGGALADRVNKKKLIVFLDALNGVLMVIVGQLDLTTSTSLWILVLLNIVQGMISAVFSPTVKALLPDLCSNKEQLVKVNGLHKSSSEIAKVLGPTISSFLFIGIGVSFSSIFALTGILTVVSAVLEYFIRDVKQTVKSGKKVHEDILEGANYLRQDKVIKGIVFNLALTNMCYAVFNLCIPIYFNAVFGRPEFYSLALTAQSIGAIVVFFVAMKLVIANDFKRLISIKLMISCLISAIAFFNVYISLFIMFLLGMYQSTYNIIIISYIQTRCEKKYLGRVFSIVSLAALSGIPITYLFSGFLIREVTPKMFIMVSLLLLGSVYHLFKVGEQQRLEQAPLESVL